jgi:hypothetical protein
VPVIIVNYDGFYDCLLDFIKTMEGHGGAVQVEVS